MFAKYIPNYGKFTPMEGYKFPKRVDKPRFSNQLSTYVDQLQTLYPNLTSNVTTSTNKWNHSPLHKNKHTPRTLIFETDEYPALHPTSHPKRNQQGTQKPTMMMATPCH